MAQSRILLKQFEKALQTVRFARLFFLNTEGVLVNPLETVLKILNRQINNLLFPASVRRC